VNWSDYPNFSRDEMQCKHTGLCDMSPEFMARLQALRTEAGFPFRITSGYRHVTHPVETKKDRPGFHTMGLACDIGTDSWTAHRLVELAYKHGFGGIGVSQRSGIPRFIHLDMRPEGRALYSY
jgi:uncharacterized protein YcbK (DUF882 family)